MNNPQFCPGDRVEYIFDGVIDGNTELIPGCVGTVIVSCGCIGVDWDHEMTLGHNLGGKCRSHRGYWVPPSAIRLAENESEDNNAVDDAEFGKILAGIQ